MNSKYTFDPEKVEYKKINNNFKLKLLRVFLYVLSSLFTAFLILIVYNFFFDTPRERKLRLENESLLSDYKLLYEKYSQIDTVIRELSDIDKNIYLTIFETEPMPDSQYSYHFNNYQELFNLTNDRLVIQTTDQLDRLDNRIYALAPEFHNLSHMAAKKEELLERIPAIQPVKNEDLTRMASGFGERMHPYYDIKKFHSGMDFTAPTGTEVYATGAGKVSEIKNTNRGHGKTIVIDHGLNYKTIYSHLNDFNVRRNQDVERGDVIGWVGNTGFSVAPHLHYEVHFKDKPVNPVNFYFLDLSPSEYDKMIELSVKSGQSFD